MVRATYQLGCALLSGAVGCIVCAELSTIVNDVETGGKLGTLRLAVQLPAPMLSVAG